MGDPNESAPRTGTKSKYGTEFKTGTETETDAPSEALRHCGGLCEGAQVQSLTLPQFGTQAQTFMLELVVVQELFCTQEHYCSILIITVPCKKP